MLKFSEIKYERPNIEEIRLSLRDKIEEFENAKDFTEANKVFLEIDSIKKDISALSNFVYIKNTLNSKDEFYEKEMEFLNENSPYIEEVLNEVNKKVLRTKFKDEFIKEYGNTLFDSLEISEKTFSKEIIPLLQEENKLTTSYSKKLAEAEIEYKGEKYNLSSISKFLSSNDREERKIVNSLIADYFYNNKDDYEEIYDKLVKIRNDKAIKLGFKNFVELGYYLMGRTDYTSKEVKKYRDSVYKNIVPIYTNLMERKRERLNYDKLYSYDTVDFLSGPVLPIGDTKYKINKAREMYKELSKETHEFFEEMVERELLDLEARPNKVGGGYCTSISKYKMPFIFSNFNGTRGDVEVLTHEAGHAFQVYNSMKEVKIESYIWPTSEACEIHSMSMEFLTWDYMDKFFKKEDVEKFKFSHLSSSLTFIPYGVTVDEFQHYVYENPNVTKEDRRKKWLEIEKKYRPTLNHDGSKYEEGIFWFKQAHIFEMPFYYIDYTLAQVCAFEFLLSSLKDKKETFERYLKLCKLGGTLPFTKLLKEVDLLNPFEEGTLEKVSSEILEILNRFDDKNM